MLGCSKQNISYWHTHSHSTQFKKSIYEVIDRAEQFFGLSLDESEFLANSAGLSLHFETVDLMEYLGYHGTRRGLCERAMISERMLRYYKEKIPTKQALLAIAVSLDMQVDEIDRLLRKYGYCLSSSIVEDIVIRWYISPKRRKERRERELLFEVNEVLERMGLPLLMTRQL